MIFTFTETKLAETGALVETVMEAVQDLNADAVGLALADILDHVPQDEQNVESCAEAILSYHAMAAQTLAEMVMTLEDFDKIYGNVTPPETGIGAFVHDLAQCKEALCDYFEEYTAYIAQHCQQDGEYGAMVQDAISLYNEATDPARQPDEPDTGYDSFCFDIMFKYLSLAQAYGGIAANSVRLHIYADRSDTDNIVLHNAGQFNEIAMGHQTWATQCWQTLKQECPEFLKMLAAELDGDDPVWSNDKDVIRHLAPNRKGGPKPPVYH